MGCGTSNDANEYKRVDKNIWRGTFTVGLRKATIKKDFSYLGDMDPYVKFKFGSNVQKSETVEDGGQFPVWEKQEFTFKRVNEDDIVHVSIWDENLIGDEFLGEGGFALCKVRKGTTSKVDQTCELYGDGQHIGTVELELTFTLDPDCKNHPEVLAPDTTGTAVLQPEKALLQKDESGYFSSLNPLVVIKLGDDQQPTAAHMEGGQNPKWSDSLIFVRDSLQRDTFVLEVQSFSESGANTLLGVGWMSFSNMLPKDSKVQKTVDLYLQGELVGNLIVNCSFVSDDPAAYGGQAKQQPQQQQKIQSEQPSQQPQQQQPQQQQPQYQGPPQSGYASYTYPNGYTYTGDFFNGLKHGKGKLNMILPGNLISTYDGSFMNDKFHGVGRYVTPTWTYEGTWENGIKHGNGIQTWTNSLQKYGGGWANGNYHGDGEWTNAQGLTQIVQYNYGQFIRYVIPNQPQQQNVQQQQFQQQLQQQNGNAPFNQFIPADGFLTQQRSLVSDNGQFKLTVTNQGGIRLVGDNQILFEIDDFEDSDAEMDALLDEQDDQIRRERIRQLQSEENRGNRRQQRQQRRKERRGRGGRQKGNRERLRGRRGQDRDNAREDENNDRRDRNRKVLELKMLMMEERQDRQQDMLNNPDDLQPPYILKLSNQGELTLRCGNRQQVYWSSQDDEGIYASASGNLKLGVTNQGNIMVVDGNGQKVYVLNEEL